MNHLVILPILIPLLGAALSLFVEHRRYGPRVQVRIEGNDDSLDTVDCPQLLLQPLVENAIKHGLLHKKTDRVLEIFFEMLKEEQMLKCTVLDNGIGRERASQLRNKKHQSFWNLNLGW
mgnify:CR=1 FL=1